MEQWYCAIGGKQYGPADEPCILSWIREGRLKATDLIWTEGMAEWLPVGSFPQFRAVAGSVPPMIIPNIPGAGGFVPPPTGGTNGRTPVLEITAAAHQSLKGRWGLPIGFCFLLGLITMAVQSIPEIGGLASLFVEGALTLGTAIFFLRFIRGYEPALGNMFDGFKLYAKTLGAHLLMLLLIFLWMLLLIIPGIIASFAYSQTFFIIADNPSIGAVDAITHSKEMMRGHKWRLFCMELWFFLLAILCIFTLGIGFLWLIPYTQASAAMFYEDLLPPLDRPLA